MESNLILLTVEIRELLFLIRCGYLTRNTPLDDHSQSSFGGPTCRNQGIQ